MIIARLAWLIFALLALSSCGRGVEVAADGGDEDAWSWDALPDIDLDEYIQPWDGPLPVKVFRNECFFEWDNLPVVLPDGQGGAIVVAPDKTLCENLYSSCYALWAQRLSPDGEKLWGEWGVQVTDYTTPSFEDMSYFQECHQDIAPDGQGGFYLVYSDYDETGNDNVIFANRVLPNGDLYADTAVKLDITRGDMRAMPSDDQLSLWVEPCSYVMGNGLLYSLIHQMYSIAGGDSYLAIIDENLDVWKFKYLNHSIFFTTWLYRTNTSQLFHLSYCVDREDVGYEVTKFIDLDGNVIFGQEALMSYSGPDNPMHVTIMKYDEEATRYFDTCDWTDYWESARNSNVVNYITCWDIDPVARSFSRIWDVDALGVAGVQSIQTLKGDGSGGVYVPALNVIRSGGCEDNRCCTRDPRLCQGEFVIQWIDPDGRVPGDLPPALLEQYVYGWHPGSVLVRSNDRNVIHFWMSPLVNTGSAIPDVMARGMGYYLCAQRHERGGAWSVWPEEPCVRVVQYANREYGQENWFDAVPDAEGGAIVVYLGKGYSLWAQRISADGRLLWNAE
jgi:hypothetical protein